MPKINQEEYEVLKGLDDKWKWIARDEDSASVEVFQVKPYKVGTVWTWDGYTCIDDIGGTKLFQFIRWEDEEPYEIAGLVEEYEIKELRLAPTGTVIVDSFDESEETEVKDIEWLKESIGVLPITDTVFTSDGTQYIDSAVPVMRVHDLIDQLDEPETKEETAKKIKIAYDNGFAEGEGKAADYFEGIMEKPTIPPFAADWIEMAKEDYELKPIQFSESVMQRSEDDSFTILPEKLSKTIDKYHHLGYFVEVLPQIWKSTAGFYNTEYVLKIFKLEELDE